MLELLQLDCLWFGIACLAGSQAGIITECCLHQVNKQPDKTVKFKPHRSLSLGADWHMVHSLRVACTYRLKSSKTLICCYQITSLASWWHIWGSSNVSKNHWKAVDLTASSVDHLACPHRFISRTSFKLKDRNQVCSHPGPSLKNSLLVSQSWIVQKPAGSCRNKGLHSVKTARTKGRCV